MVAQVVISLSQRELRRARRDIDRVNRLARRSDYRARGKAISVVHTNSVRGIATAANVKQKEVRKRCKKYIRRVKEPNIWLGSKGYPVGRETVPSSARNDLRVGPLLDRPVHEPPFDAKLKSGKRGKFFRRTRSQPGRKHGEPQLPIDQAHFDFFRESRRIIERFLDSVAVPTYRKEFDRLMNVGLKRNRPRR